MQLQQHLFMGLPRESQTLQTACTEITSLALRHTANTPAFCAVRDQFIILANLFDSLRGGADDSKSFWNRFGVETALCQLALPQGGETAAWISLIEGGILSEFFPVWASLSDPPGLGGVQLFTGTELGMPEPAILGIRQFWQDNNYDTWLSAGLNLIYKREREGQNRERIIIEARRERLLTSGSSSIPDTCIKQEEELHFVRRSREGTDEPITLNRIALAETRTKGESSQTTRKEVNLIGAPPISELNSRYPLPLLDDLSRDIDLGVEES